MTTRPCDDRSIVPRRRGSARARRWAAWAPLVLLATVSAGAAERPAETGAGRPVGKPGAVPAVVRKPIRDPAVVQAGGGGCHDGRCRVGRAHGHHADCREGRCVPYCPVRPDVYGYYGTQWRQWPGAQLVAFNGERGSTPVAPPKSAVPTPEEESLAPDDESTADEPATPESPAPAALPPTLPPALPPEPAPEPAAPAPEPPVEPAPAEPAPAESTTPAVPTDPVPEPEPPAAAPKPARPEDENLFDDSSVGRVRRKLAAVGGPSDAGRIRPLTHAEPLERPAGRTPAGMGGARDPKRVPRVPFDPRVEEQRLRGSR